MKKLSEEKDGDLSTMSMFSCQCWQQLEDYILRNTTRIWIPVGSKLGCTSGGFNVCINRPASSSPLCKQVDREQRKLVPRTKIK